LTSVGTVYCGAGKSCSYYESMTGAAFAMCADKDLCDSITSPQAAMFYKNAKCCNTPNCNAPGATATAPAGPGTTSAPAPAGPGGAGSTSATVAGGPTGAGGAASVQTLSSLAGLTVVLAFFFF
jgi:hypothetical protein